MSHRRRRGSRLFDLRLLVVFFGAGVALIGFLCLLLAVYMNLFLPTSVEAAEFVGLLRKPLALLYREGTLTFCAGWVCMVAGGLALLR